jgi:hypothetical protein
MICLDRRVVLAQIRGNESRMRDYETKFLRNVKVYATIYKIIKTSRRSIITESLGRHKIKPKLTNIRGRSIRKEQTMQGTQTILKVNIYITWVF